VPIGRSPVSGIKVVARAVGPIGEERLAPIDIACTGKMLLAGLSTSGGYMFDKLFELVAKSTGFGFALAFSGTVFLAGNRYDWWSVTLKPEQTFYIIMATLLGYGILIASALANGFRICLALADLGWAYLNARRKDNLVMDRLHELTPRQIAPLWWISQNPPS